MRNHNYPFYLKILKLICGGDLTVNKMQDNTLRDDYKKNDNCHLWNPSTYIETVGHISEEAIEKYIRDQKKK